MTRSTRYAFFAILASILLSFHAQVSAQVIEPTSFVLRDDIINVEKSPDSWKLQFVCEARIGQCKIQYIFLPSQWTVQGQKIIVPIEDTNRVRVFALQANVSEPTGDSALKDIEVDFEGGQIRLKINTISSSSILDWRNNPLPSLSNLTPALQVSTTNTGTRSTTSASSNIGSTPSTGNVSRSQVQVNPVVANSSQPATPATSQVVNEFGQTYLEAHNIVSNLPSMEKIKSVVSGGDIGQIAITIQNVVEYEMACEEKLPYLRDAEKVIQDQIQASKTFVSNENMRVINQNQTLRNLIIEKQSIESQLNITGTKKEVERNIQQLEYEKSKRFSDFFNYARISNIYKDRLASMIQAAGVGFDELKELRASVETDKESVAKLEEEIKKIIIEKTYIERRIEANEKKIREVELSGGNIDEARIASLESKFKEYSAMSAHAQQAYFKAEEDLAKAKQRYENYEEEINNLTSRLNEINAALKEAQKNAVNKTGLNQIQTRIASLERNLPGIQSQIQHCQELLPDQTSPPVQDKSAPIPVNPVIPDIFELRRENTISQQINFFTADWIMQYGVPQPFRFSCSNFNTTSGYGQIVRIKSSTMRVMNLDNGSQYDLHIGICSRLNAKNSFYVPKAGDVIDWEGVYESANVLNIYRAQIYSL